jgi:chemotaxis protein histidine kinase CheA
MEKKVIDLEVTSNIGESISDLKALKRQLKDTAAGSEEFKKIFNQIDDLEDKIKSAKSSSSDWIDSLENAGGPLGMVGAGLNKAKVATQSFGGALKATGIGLFVSLIGGLVAAFKDNEEATKKLQPLLDGLSKIFQGVFRAVEPLFNIIVDLAISALPMVSEAFSVVYGSVTAVFQSLGSLGSAIKKLVSGDFSGAWKDAKSSVNDFSKNYDDSIKRFNEGTKELTKTEKEEAEKREEARKKALEKKEAAEEKSKQAAIKKAEEEAAKLKAIADKKLADDMKSAQDALNIVNELNKSYETPAQKETREYEEKKAILEANNLSTELLTQKHLENLDLIKKTDKEKQDKDDAEWDAYVKTTDDKNSKDEIDREKAVADQKKAIQDAQLGLASGAVGFLNAVAGKNKALQKTAIIAENAIGIAKMIIANNAANIGALATPQAIATSGAAAAPVIAMNNITTALGVATTIAATAKALSAVGGGGGGGGAPSGGGATGGGGAAPQFNVVGNSGVNQLANVMNTKEQQAPIKTYVVASDVTSGQSLDRNIIQNASLG